ncbi:uncharacterized protein LOC126335439 [Schistocerca gregaria]|uniref:uncharacterized protein LOC126335439 n=1 Tax=Schistocerca gregaria TaxID=7010 RepID=UPI00211EF042|nr:uncharacterized protein LOC126335439 [Schistocerca gregaria]
MHPVRGTSLKPSTGVMTKERDEGNLGNHRRPGPGPGHGSGCNFGRGRGGVPEFGRGRGRGRGRAKDAIYRSEQISGSSVGSGLYGDSAPSSPQGTGYLTSQPGKQTDISGLQELVEGFRGSKRSNIRANKGTNQTPSTLRSANRRGGHLSWADMRRQSQRSNSTTDDSSEPDGSQRAFLSVSGSEGGWGGRGRGRLLDTTNIRKSDSSKKPAEDTSVWSGQGRGGILYVPGVSFHSGPGSPGWKRGTSNKGMLNSRHVIGGHAANYAGQFSQSFQRKEIVTHSSDNKNCLGWKKSTKDKESNNETKNDNLQLVESFEERVSHMQGSFVPYVQQSDRESVSNVENTEDVPPGVTEGNRQVNDIISPTESDDEKLLYQRKHSNVNNIEESFQKQLIVRTDNAVPVNTEKCVVPISYSTEQKRGRKEICPPRGGRSRGILLFGASFGTDGGTSGTRNAVACKNIFL